MKKLDESTAYKDLKAVFDNYLSMRKKIKKPATDEAIRLALKKLDELAPDNDNLKIEILNQSILNSWQGLFPLKQETNEKTGRNYKGSHEQRLQAGNKKEFKTSWESPKE